MFKYGAEWHTEYKIPNANMPNATKKMKQKHISILLMHSPHCCNCVQNSYIPLMLASMPCVYVLIQEDSE